MLKMYLHLSNLGLGLSTVVDISNTGARASAEDFPAQRAMRLEHTV